MSPETNDDIRRLSQRSMALATVCLAVVVLIMAVAFVFMVLLARDAQESADKLRDELECRSIYANNHDIKKGELYATIADGLLHLSTGEPLDDIETTMERQVAELREAGRLRTNSIVTCRAASDATSGS